MVGSSRAGHWLVLVAVGAFLHGCADTSATESNAPNLAVWPPDASKLAAVNHGGGFGPQIEGSYTATVADRRLTWHICPAFLDPGDTCSDGTRTLDAAELANVVSALHMVKLTAQTFCGSDKGLLSLKVTAPAGEKEYFDSFYACSKMGVYVDNIDGVFSVLQALAN